MESLPIDIHTAKLVEWLISRRHIKRNWSESIRIVREKINSAIQDMPEHPDVTKLLSGSYINYFHCLQIIKILCETEKDTKNIFGWYSSQRMKDWREIINLYEKDNLYLAESGQFLVRNVAYDAPSIKKQIARCLEIVQECDRKVAEANKRAANAKDKYYGMCKQMDIRGDNVKEEIFGLLANLPDEFSKLAQLSKGLNEARLFYVDFLKFTIRNKASEEAILPLLNFIIEHGDSTIYEYKYGTTPISVLRPQIDTLEKEEAKDGSISTDDIDFGDLDVSEKIDYGNDDDPTSSDIDWCSIEVVPDVDKINWDTGSIEVDTNFEIKVESAGVSGGIAEGDEALSLLYTDKTRTQFINELHELDGFLKQRVTELRSKECILSMSQFNSAPKSLQYQTGETISGYITLLANILNVFQSVKMQHLYLIASSPKYVVRLTKSVDDKLRDSRNLVSSVAAIDKQRETAMDNCKRLTTHLNLIVDKSREIKGKVEHHISLKYNKRPVNLMGEICVL